MIYVEVEHHALQGRYNHILWQLSLRILKGQLSHKLQAYYSVQYDVDMVSPMMHGW